MNKLLTNRNFLLLWGAQALEQIADSLTLMALISWIKDVSILEKATINISFLMLYIGLPIVLIGPFAGVLLDKMKKRTVMYTAALTRGTAIFAMAVLAGSAGTEMPYIFAIVFLISAVSQFFIPAKSAIIPSLVPKNKLLAANSISATTAVLFQIFTYAASGLLIEKTGEPEILFTCFLLYLVVAFCVFLIDANEKIEPHKNITAHNVLHDFLTGIKFLFKNQKVLFMVRRIFFLFMSVGFFYVAIAGDFLNRIITATGVAIKEVTALGFMQGCLGMGLVAGVFFLQRISKRFSPESIIRILFPLMGALIIILFFARNFYYFLASAFFAGLAAVITVSLVETVIQKNTPDKLRGKILTAYYIIRNATLAGASALTGVIIKGGAGIKITEAEIVLLAGMIPFVYGIVNLAGSLFKKTDRGIR